MVLCAALASATGVWATASGGAPGDAGAAATSPGSRVTGPATAGLGQTWTSASGTWAVVAMGRYDQPLNTFWQMLFRPAGTARWTLVTPPGVASNGGFSAGGLPGATGAPGVVTAGFQPSQDLTYSPVAQSTDDGKSWSVGTLSSGLLPVAGAVADGAGGAVFALVRSGGGTLVRSDGSLTAWKPLLTLRSLDATGAGRRCGVEALTALVDAVGAGPAPSLELGTACAAPGVVGLFHLSSGRWVATTVREPGEARSTFTVLRLQRGASGTSAIVEARRAGTASLVALWRPSPSARWATSSAVRLDGAVLSTASTGGTSLLVVTGRGFRAEDLLWAGGPGRAWRSLGAPPAGTQVVAAAPGAVQDPTTSTATGAPKLVALEVSGSDVWVWERAADGTWHRTAQRLDVPIEYGSST